MRLRFGVDDEEAFGEARERLLEGFAAWAAGSGRQVDDDPAFQALSFKWGYLDGHLGRWRVSDLAEVLLELYPRKTIVDEEYLPLVVPGLHAFLDYLQEKGWLTGDPPQVLHAALDELAEPFRAAMADTSRHGPAKALVGAMLAEGVALDDPEAVQRYMDEFNARPYEERAALIPGPARETLVPVALPGDAELGQEALATPLLQRLLAFVEYIGAGHKLTKTGNLTVADGRALAALLDTGEAAHADQVRSATELPEVDLAFRIALDTRSVKKVKGVLSATRKGREIERDPLEAWREAFIALLGQGLVGGPYYAPFWVDFLDEGVLGLLGLLYVAGGRVPVGLLEEGAWEQLADELDPDDFWYQHRDLAREGLSRDLGRMIDRLELTGALQREDGGDVRLTPLGAWLARPVLVAQGYEAPLIGDLSGTDAATLLQSVEEYPPDAAEAEIRLWIERRGPTAATELAETLRAEQDPATRVMIFSALALLADEAEPTIRSLRDDPLLRPYASLWLVDRGLEPPAALDPGAAPEMMVETLAAILAVAGPDEMIEQFRESAPDQRGVLDALDALWRADNPHTANVLEAFAQSADKPVVKAARRSLFRHRSAAARRGG